MHYAIQSEFFHTRFLNITARKKALKHKFYHIESGTLLLRLGKYEYIVSSGQSIWIPFNCLNALTFLPGTQGLCLEFSIRLDDPFPAQAGYVELSGLMPPLMKRLKNCTRQDAVFPHLNGVLKDEVLNFHPALPDAANSPQVLKWNADQTAEQNHIPSEMHIALLIREARKMSLSGKKPEQIAQKLFQGKLAQYQQLCQSLLGEI